jgi:ketosteroid isomerase-like protein
MRGLTASLGVLCFTAAIAVGADDPAVKEIEALSDDYTAATKAQDEKFFQNRFSERLLVIGKDGARSDKKQYIKESLDPKVKYESLDCTEREVRVFGDTAVETGKIVAVGKSDGKPFRSEVRYTDVWAKEKGKWMLVSEQVTALKAP